MDALNAAPLSPLSVLLDRKKQPLRKLFSLPSPSSSSHPLKSSSSSTSHQPLPLSFSTTFHGSLALLSSLLTATTTQFSQALTYEEALQKYTTTPSSSGELDPTGFINSIAEFATDNPAVLLGGATLLVVPLVLGQILGKPKPYGVESARSAYRKLGEDLNAQLLDIRPSVELRKVGSPDLKGVGKKPVSIAYNGEGKQGFLKKLGIKFKEPENTTLFILDKFDGNSELVAELATVNGFKAAYAIKDGAEGPRGWTSSGLPWISPRVGSSLAFSNFTEAISSAIGEGSSDALSLSLTLAVVAGLGLFAFTEIETILQLLGSAVLVQLVSKRLLFAEDRKQSLQQVDEFLNTKVAPKELVDEIKQIGKALLPSPVASKALPPPVEAAESAEPVKSIDTVPKAEEAEPVLTASDQSKVETPSESPPEINSVPKLEVKAESVTGFSSPLSPYTSYPELKPPTSPIPSQP